MSAKIRIAKRVPADWLRRNRPMKRLAPYALLALTPFSGYATTTETAPPRTKTPVAEKSDKLGLYALASVDHRFGAKLSDGATGRVSRTVTDLECIWSGALTDEVWLDLDFENKWTDNTFTSAAPYGDTRSHFLGAHVVKMFDKKWGWGAVGATELAAENGADLWSDGLRGGAGASLVWRPSETLSTETGATIQSLFGQDPVLSPYIRWKWTPRADLELELRATGLQNGVAGTWYLTENKATSLRVSLFYETSLYALRDGGPAEGLSVGEIPLRVSFTQFLSETFFVSLRGDLTLYRRDSFYTDNTRVAEFRTGVTPGVGLLCGLRL